jgi:hypothetical protein
MTRLAWAAVAVFLIALAGVAYAITLFVPPVLAGQPAVPTSPAHFGNCPAGQRWEQVPSGFWECAR